MIATPLSDVPAHARVWIYQADRALADAERAEAAAMLEDFARQWASHSAELAAFGKLLFGRFVVLAVDEAQLPASGCSIDSSVQFLKSLEARFGLSLFDRLTFAYLDGEQIKTANKDEFSALYKTGKINDKTLVFNNLVGTKAEMEHHWLVPLSESWHRNFV